VEPKIGVTSPARWLPHSPISALPAAMFGRPVPDRQFARAFVQTRCFHLTGRGTCRLRSTPQNLRTYGKLVRDPEESTSRTRMLSARPTRRKKQRSLIPGSREHRFFVLCQLRRPHAKSFPALGTTGKCCPQTGRMSKAGKIIPSHVYLNRTWRQYLARQMIICGRGFFAPESGKNGKADGLVSNALRKSKLVWAQRRPL